MPGDFVHLNVHSTASQLRGVGSAPHVANKISKLGQHAVAFTEYGHLASVPNAYTACKSSGIKYIPGCSLIYNDFELERQEFEKSGANVYDLRRTDTDRHDRLTQDRSVTVLCKNLTGFSNLLTLTTLAWKDNPSKKPKVWFEKLCEYKEGLVILSGGMNGPIWHELFMDTYHRMVPKTKYNRPKNAKSSFQYIEMFKEAFGDDFYLEVQMPLMRENYDNLVFQLHGVLAAKYNIKRVLTNECCYLKREDHEITRLMAAIGQGITVDELIAFNDTDELFLKSRAELAETFIKGEYGTKSPEGTFDSLCDMTLEIAEKCDNFNPDVNIKLPDWGAINGLDADEELKRLADESLKQKGLYNDDSKHQIDGRAVTYREQAALECNRFISKGFASYFLITRDLVMFGKERGWPFGPRGSAGGSLVCYLLGITAINPILWNLSFDRFMSSSRGGFMLAMDM